MFFKRPGIRTISLITLVALLLQLSISPVLANNKKTTTPTENSLTSSTDSVQVANAKTALSKAASLKPTEGTDTNVTVMAQAIVDQVSTGVKVAVSKSSNRQISRTGAISYGTIPVSGGVTFKLTKNLSSTTQGMNVVVPAKSTTDPDYLEVVAAQNVLANAGTFCPIEGTDANIITMAHAIIDESVSSITITISSSANSQIASDGTINYGIAAVRNNVTFKLAKNSASITETINVAVPAKIQPDQDAADVTAAKTALINAGGLQPAEGTDASAVIMAQKIVDQAVSNVVVKITTTNNSQVGTDGTITYGNSDVKGTVTFSINKGTAADSVIIPLTVPAHSMTDAEAVEKARAAVGAVGTLMPVEGTDTSIKTMIQVIVDKATPSVSVEITSSANPQVGADGIITYGLNAGIGTISVCLTKNNERVNQDVAVKVPAHITIDGISCSALGLVKNNANAGQQNMALLLQALLAGKKVLVDGVYYLKNGSQAPISNMTISLMGSTSNAEIKLDQSSGTLFNIANNVNVDISNIKFTQSGSSVRYILTFASDCLCNKVIIDNNDFEGPIRLIEFKGSTTIDPSVKPFGIKELSFDNNTVNNAAYSFIRMNDVPSDKIVVQNNNIHNFDYTFLTSAITNDITFEQKMFYNKKNFVVRNNMVTCDDDWWGKTDNTTYYCFVLFEGIDCIYEGNHVEGLKFYSGSGSGAALYDSYLSCLNLTYTGNTWKNNLNFNPGKLNNTLLKSKGGPDGIPTNRYYENNSYVVEKSYIEMCSAQLADKFGQDSAVRLAADLSAGWIEMISLTHECGTYYLLNNSFDVYELRMFASAVPVDEMHIVGNTIRCQKIGGQLLNYNVADGTDCLKKSQIVTNNTIQADTLTAYSPFYLIKGSSDKYGYIEVENNNISAPLSYLVYQTSADKAVVKGNTVDVANPAAIATCNGIYRSDYINDLTVENNSFI